MQNITKENNQSNSPSKIKGSVKGIAIMLASLTLSSGCATVSPNLVKFAPGKIGVDLNKPSFDSGISVSFSNASFKSLRNFLN